MLGFFHRGCTLPMNGLVLEPCVSKADVTFACGCSSKAPRRKMQFTWKKTSASLVCCIESDVRVA